MLTTGLRFSRALLGTFLVAATAAALLLAGVSAASAHSGPYKLNVATDGAGGISVTGKYEADGHTVDAIMDVVATAKSKDGKEAGPVNLVSSAEGQGIWISPEPFLADGEWTVTVTTTTPNKATASTTFVVAPLAAPVAPEPLAASGDGNNAGSGAGSPTGVWPWLVGGLLAGAAAVAGAFALLHRRAAKLAA